mgnify:CR=1 FL=1
MAMKTSDQFAALGHELRLNLFRYIIHSGKRGRTSGEIAAAFDMPASTRSAHLKRLERAGLLQVERGAESPPVYRVQEESMRKLVRFLVEDCCESHPELCGISFTR